MLLLLLLIIIIENFHLYNDNDDQAIFFRCFLTKKKTLIRMVNEENFFFSFTSTNQHDDDDDELTNVFICMNTKNIRWLTYDVNEKKIFLNILKLNLAKKKLKSKFYMWSTKKKGHSSKKKIGHSSTLENMKCLYIATIIIIIWIVYMVIRNVK